ncbi:MAG TPA: response regulator [Methylomirabilota bacterium]
MADLLSGIRIVYVEDDDDTREVWEAALRHMGATVTSVRSARAALDAVANADIVVTDFLLPSEDGVWLLEQVNQQPRPVPVIAISGFAEVHIPRLAEAPFARTLLKPVDSLEVAHIIVDVVRGASLER